MIQNYMTLRDAAQKLREYLESERCLIAGFDVPDYIWNPFTVALGSSEAPAPSIKPDYYYQNAWIQTYTGKRFQPFNPRQDDICIEDIAHSLALQCRFTGHTSFHYSVAQHCYLASYYAVWPGSEVFFWRQTPLEDRQTALWALLHDASEAYLTDMAKPIKENMPEYNALEKTLMRAICQRFGLPEQMPAVVKEVDLRMLITERRDLLGHPPAPWDVDLMQIKPYQMNISQFNWQVVEQDFLQRFRELTGN